MDSLHSPCTTKLSLSENYNCYEFHWHMIITLKSKISPVHTNKKPDFFSLHAIDSIREPSKQIGSVISVWNPVICLWGKIGTSRCRQPSKCAWKAKTKKERNQSKRDRFDLLTFARAWDKRQIQAVSRLRDMDNVSFARAHQSNWLLTHTAALHVRWKIPSCASVFS